MNQKVLFRPSDMILGEVYFWTSTILSWNNLLLDNSFKQIVINSLKYLADKDHIKVYGFVIMPNHIHLICELLKLNKKEMPDTSFSKYTAHEFKKNILSLYPDKLENYKVSECDRMYRFWQRDPLAIHLTNKQILLQKLEYLHLNPLQEKWNLVTDPEEYFWSSAKFYNTSVDDFGFLTHFSERI